MKQEKFKVTESCGNVFLDLGFSPEEATILAMRSQLMGELHIKIRDQQWTQAEAAKVLGIARIRPDTRKVGQVQPGYADYFGDESGKESRTQAGGVNA